MQQSFFRLTAFVTSNETRNMKSSLLLAVAMYALAVPQAVCAQEYARATGDTLRYQETTDVDVEVVTPQGTIPVEVNTVSEMEMTHATPDTLTAWYTNLSVATRSPMGNQNPDASAVLNEPFRVAFDPKGHTLTTTSPDAPPSLRGMFDIQRQFDDFFLILPEDELTVGYSWEYLAAADDSVDGARSAFSKRGQLTVLGDTLVNGKRGLKISGDLDATLSNSTYVPEQGVTVLNEFAGVEHNVFVFSVEEGMLLLRERTADLSGTSTYEGGPMPMSMEQHIAYVSALRLMD